MMSGTKMRLVLVGTILSVGLVGCASKGGGSSTRHASAAGSSSYESSSVATTQGVGQDESFASQDTWGRSQKELLADRTFHFQFDRFDVKPEDQQAIMAHAEYLANNPNKKVRLEGHTDQRGSREYNVALGERRSNSVRDVMLAHGVKPNQIKTVSYGEEKPAARGTDEASYSQNRRAQIVYE